MFKIVMFVAMSCWLLSNALMAENPAEKSAPPENSLQATEPVNAEVAFARFKRLAGEWRARSSKGWTGGNVARVIARGSAVLFESAFDDDKESGMATIYYLDKGRLLLTHYCESKTQPTLVATGQSADGKTLLFTFLSGTGMANRDTGHMDKLLFRFIGDDAYALRWTWYGKGSEQWLEEIENRRASKDSAAPGQP